MKLKRNLQILLFVPIHDLSPGRYPHLLPRRHMRQRLGEIFAPVRHADQERMQADRHHAAGLGAVLVEDIELVADHLPEGLGALVQVEQRRNVVDLRRIGQRDHRALLHPHRIGLLVVDPVADVFDAVLGEDVERAHGFAQGRAEPAARRLSDALGDGLHHLADQGALFLFGLLVDQDRVGDAVAHPLPAELVALLDDAWVLVADVGVERDRALEAVLLHDLHHPPDADADAVVTPGVVQHVGIEAEPAVGHARRGPVEQEVLDVRDHPERDPRAVRPFELRPVDDRRIVEPAVLERHRHRAGGLTRSALAYAWRLCVSLSKVCAATRSLP